MSGDLAYECVSDATLAGLATKLNAVKIVDGTLVLTYNSTANLYVVCYLRIT